MHCQHALVLVHFLIFQVLSNPISHSNLNDIFNHPDIPVLNDFKSSDFNLTLRSDGEGATSKRAVNRQYVLYQITMDGRNQGNWQNFVTTGSFVWVQGIPSNPTTNGVNPYDIFISIGNPPVSPIAGAIRYTTNRALSKYIAPDAFAASALDFAYVRVVGNRIDVTVDGRLAAANPFSDFNARSGLLADVYEVASGGLWFTPTSSKISGYVNTVGTGFTFHGAAPYKAFISGKVLGRGTIRV